MNLGNTIEMNSKLSDLPQPLKTGDFKCALCFHECAIETIHQKWSFGTNLSTKTSVFVSPNFVQHPTIFHCCGLVGLAKDKVGWWKCCGATNEMPAKTVDLRFCSHPWELYSQIQWKIYVIFKWNSSKIDHQNITILTNYCCEWFFEQMVKSK